MTRTLLGNGLVVRTDAPTESQVYAQRLARMRASALRGIARDASNGDIPEDCVLTEVTSAGPTCLITNRPQTSRPEPVERKPLSLLSKNGKRLPLRAFGFHDLNREFWSNGKVVMADVLERQQARELTAHETPVEAMTLDQLIETQDREPLLESRRAWLEWGRFDSHIAGRSMNGTVSLEGYAEREGSIGETLFSKGIDAIHADDIAADSLTTGDFFADEASSFGKGIAYEGIDPITQKQIDWEQEKYYVDAPVKVTIASKPDGGLSIQTDRKLLPEPMMRLARSVKRTLLDEHAGWDNLTHQFHTLAEDAALAGFISADENEERERFLAPADDLWHSSYEEAHPMVAILPNSECLRNFGGFCNFADCYCGKDDCTYTECHYHVRVARTVHRNGRRNKDELWHRRLFDVTAFELGTDGLVSPLAEAI